MSPIAPIRPKFSNKAIKSFAKQFFGIDVPAQQLPGYIDQNFYLKEENGHGYVFKVANQTERFEILDLQNKAMEYLYECSDDDIFPCVIKTIAGESIKTVKNDEGRSVHEFY